MVKLIFHYISFLIVCSKYKISTIKGLNLGLGPQALECKLNPYWSKLRLREKHDVMLFSFYTCPSIPKTLLTQKSDSIFVLWLPRYSIFCCLLGVIFVPLMKKTTSEMYVASLTLLILDFRISTFRYSTFRYSSFDTRVSILDISILEFRYSTF